MNKELKNWLKQHWKLIAISLLIAVALWIVGQKVAAVGSAFAALWKWLFAKGREVAADAKIKRTRRKREQEKRSMIDDVRKAIQESNVDDPAIDEQTKELAAPNADKEKAKADVLDLLDQYDAMERCTICRKKGKLCKCPPSLNH